MNTTAKDTFWNRKRVEKGVSLKCASRDLNIEQTALSHYFTGMRLPPTAISVRICDYFGVDYITGAEEFNKAHEAWVAENPGKKRKRSHIRSRKYDFDNLPTVPIPDVPQVPEDNITELEESKCDRLLRLLYNKVDYPVYMEVVQILNK